MSLSLEDIDWRSPDGYQHDIDILTAEMGTAAETIDSLERLLQVALKKIDNMEEEDMAGSKISDVARKIGDRLEKHMNKVGVVILMGILITLLYIIIEER